MARAAAASRQAPPAVPPRKPSPKARAAAARLTAPETGRTAVKTRKPTKRSTPPRAHRSAGSAPPRAQRSTGSARSAQPRGKRSATPRAQRPAGRASGRSTKQVRRALGSASRSPLRSPRLLPRGLAGLGLRLPRPVGAAGAAAGAAKTSPGTASLPALRAPLARGARAGGGRLLDALLSGRAWIALVFVLLAGIVFFNVDLLQLNRQIAVGTERAAELKQANATLRLKLAELGSSERVQAEAAEAGFVRPAPGDVRYLSTGQRDARRALKLIEAPAPITPTVTATTPATTDPLAAPTDPTTAAPVTDPAAVTPPVTPDPTTGAAPTTAVPPAAG